MAAKAFDYPGEMPDGSLKDVCRGGHRLFTCEQVLDQPLAAVGLGPGWIRLVCRRRGLCGGVLWLL